MFCGFTEQVVRDLLDQRVIVRFCRLEQRLQIAREGVSVLGELAAIIRSEPGEIGRNPEAGGPQRLGVQCQSGLQIGACCLRVSDMQDAAFHIHSSVPDYHREHVAAAYPIANRPKRRTCHA
jgi:hypothetical protein